MSIQIQVPNIEQYPDLTISEVYTHNFAPAKMKVFDKELFGTKWWDYRFDTPFDATMKYIDAFGEEARKIYSRDIDYERAQHIQVVTAEKMLFELSRNSLKAKRSFSGFWRGRQVADAIGMPYGTYVYEALSARMRRWQRVYLPGSNQIYQDGDVERVSNRWDELKASRIYFSEHHAYLTQNYQGGAIQTAYFDYLVERARSTSDFYMTIKDMVEADRLPLEYLAAHQQGIYEKVSASLM